MRQGKVMEKEFFNFYKMRIIQEVVTPINALSAKHSLHERPLFP
jgi:hypothetical protein